MTFSKALLLIGMLSLCSLSCLDKKSEEVQASDSNADWAQWLSDRTTIVNKIKSKEFKKNASSEYELAEEFRHLSPGDSGKVFIVRDNEQTEVIFWKTRFILGAGSGFVYTSDGKYTGNYDRIEKLSEHWFYFF